MKLGYRGNLQAMLVLRLFKKKTTPKSDGVFNPKSEHHNVPSERKKVDEGREGNRKNILLF